LPAASRALNSSISTSSSLFFAIKGSLCPFSGFKDCLCEISSKSVERFKRESLTDRQSYFRIYNISKDSISSLVFLRQAQKLILRPLQASYLSKKLFLWIYCYLGLARSNKKKQRFPNGNK